MKKSGWPKLSGIPEIPNITREWGKIATTCDNIGGWILRPSSIYFGSKNIFSSVPLQRGVFFDRFFLLKISF